METEIIDLFWSILEEKLGDELENLYGKVPIIIIDSKEKNDIEEQLKEMGAFCIRYNLHAGDYLVSSEMGFELKRTRDFSNSVFGGPEHNIFDQMFRLAESVRYPNLIIQGFSYLYTIYEESQMKSLEGAKRYFQSHYSTHETNTDKQTATLIYNLAASEQKEKKGGHARSVPKKLTTDQKKEFFIQGLPLIGSELSKEIMVKYDKKILDFLNDVLKVDIEYTKSGNLKNTQYLGLEKVGPKKILEWREILT